MAKVTRIAYSKQLNRGKFERLSELARRLGIIRSEVWGRYGSLAGLGVRDRDTSVHAVHASEGDPGEKIEQNKRLGLLNPDTSCNGPTDFSLSTVSELPFV